MLIPPPFFEDIPLLYKFNQLVKDFLGPLEKARESEQKVLYFAITKVAMIEVL